MKKIFLVLISSLTLFSCDSNPLGKTSFSDCGHSPDSDTGLPLECQINAPFTEDLFAWLDAHDSGTVILQNQTNVTSWLDKSGNSNHLIKIGLGDSATVKKKSSNDRNSILFPTTSTTYGVDHILAGFPGGQSFTIAISFKTATVSEDTLTITNNNNFDLKLNAGGDLTYSIGSLSDVSTGVVFTGNNLYKIIFTYNNDTKSITILNSKGVVHTRTLGFSNGSWADFQITTENSLEINEILIYTSAVDSTAVQSYLNSKWGF